MEVLNPFIGEAIKYHDILHGFWVIRGTGTTSLKAKLLQKLTAARKEVLYKVLLDLRNPYEVLDQEICLEIIVVYIVGARTEKRFYCYC